MTQQNYIRTIEIYYKIFDNSHLEFGKGKKAKIKNSIFDGPLIVNQTFSQTEFVIDKSYFAHIMHFHQNICPIFVKVENILSLKDAFRSILQIFYRAVILSWVNLKTSNFQQTFRLIVTFKKLYCRVYCYFCVLDIKLIQTICKEMKQQFQRPITSTMIDPYTSICQLKI